jgi:hypothetical protein
MTKLTVNEKNDKAGIKSQHIPAEPYSIIIKINGCRTLG